LFAAEFRLSAAESAAPAAKTSPKSPVKNTGDAEIEMNIRARLAKSKLAADHFTVSVTRGVATLQGVTDVAQHKGVMTRMAKAAGAIAVRNNIQVSAAGKAKTAAAFAKARSRPAQGASHTGTSAPGTKRTIPTQIPHATVLPQD
jgi:hypothetical protein